MTSAIISAVLRPLCMSRLDSIIDSPKRKGQNGRVNRNISLQFIAKIERACSTKEAAGLKDGNNVALQVAERFAMLIEVERVLESVHRQHTANEASVPTKQHAAKASNSCKEVCTTVGLDVGQNGSNIKFRHSYY